MKLKTHPHKSDLLTLTKAELKRISEGEEMRVSALVIRLEEEPKPDTEYWLRTYEHSGGSIFCPHLLAPTEIFPANIKLTFDGETGKLKSAEVL